MIPKEIIKKVRHIEIRTKGLVNDLFGGEYHSIFKGRGMTFSEVREYVAGDDIRMIDWNVTARNDAPFVKIFEEERELGDCVFFDMRTLHGNLNEVTPKNNVHRYTLRMAKEGSRVEYRGDWAKEERAIMEANGYKNGDDLSGKMFPTLYEVHQ